MPSAEALPLTADEIDDLLYFTRTGDKEELEQSLGEIAQRTGSSQNQVLCASAVSSTGNTVLHYASANGHRDILQLLLGKLELNKSTISDDAESKRFINSANAEGNTALHWAAYNGHLEVVKQLITVGADMWRKNSAGHLAMFEAERADKTDVVQYLLEVGGTEVERTGRTGVVTAEDLADVDASAEDMAKNTNGADVDMQEAGPSG